MDIRQGNPAMPSKGSSKSTMPDLKRFVDKRVLVRLTEGRKISGTLRGYDHFMNLVLADAADEFNVNNSVPMGICIVRGNTVINIEPLFEEE